MTGSDGSRWLGLGELAELLARRDVSPVELATATLDRIEELDGDLHAFVAVTRERAMAESSAAERELAAGSGRGPLHGVPYAVKDLFDVEGEVTGAGCRLLSGNVAAADATVVRRLRDAGMVLVGKTHTVQFAFGGVGINHDTGTPRNPWRADEPFVPGGSSSGSAVAVAAGVVPVALGSDTSGSVRVPASLCGVSGLKTTVGRVSRAGVYPLSPTLDSVGQLARSAADCALLDEVIAGFDPADQATADGPGPAAASALEDGVAGLRLAIIENFFFDGVDAEVDAAVRAAADSLAGLGAEVISIEAPEIDEVIGGRDAPFRAQTVAAEACVINRRFLEETFDELDPVVATRMRRGFELSAVELLETFESWPRLRAAFAERTVGIDAFLSPATLQPARSVAEVDATAESYARFNAMYLRNTSIGNRMAWCGLSVPCGFTSDGLPIGLMVQAPGMHEHVAARIGHAYQQSTDWHLRRPPT